MRKDMSKVLVEDGRRNARGAKIYKRRYRRKFNDSRTFEEAPKHTGTGRRTLYGWDAKVLNEFLNPLIRFLERPTETVTREVFPARYFGGKEIVKERITVHYGPKDKFFGNVGGTKHWHHRVAKPDLKKVRAKYGSLKVYCPEYPERKQVNSKDLKRMGLKNDR